MQEESEEPTDTSLSFSGRTGREDYKQRRSRKVDTPSGREVAAVIHEAGLVICLHNF